MIEVTCMCGYQVRGTEDDVVKQLQEHGIVDHGAASSRETILALAVPVGLEGDAGTP